MTDPTTYNLYAIKYAHHDRPPSMNFIESSDFHETNMPLDFFVWAAVSDDRTFVIDTGFNAETAARRGRELIRCPSDGLALIGVDAAEARDVIITHMHYDHVGNFDLFPNATYHLQDREMNFATGRNMAHHVFNAAYDVEDVVGMVREVYGGRVTFHDGDAELAPGLSVHHIGGHTEGIMSVRVFTKRGWVVLASDASHLYANMETANPFPIVYNVGEMVDGYARLRELVDSDDHIVPGHDPKVLERYPAVSGELEGIAVRLDVAPKG
ncbi:MAG: N-acyl homoserine lactonase family protein [Rhodospirillaceae bacterium]|nr:N-acyl homoserine lactonase family protein [Rhodospirillaceae bacterium]